MLQVMHKLMSKYDITNDEVTTNKSPLLRLIKRGIVNFSHPTKTLAHALYKVVHRLIGMKCSSAIHVS